MSASVVVASSGGPRPSAPSRAAALLSLLDEPRAELRAHALSALSAIVDVEWSAVASSVATIEALYEDEGFGARLDAAMLASKVRMRGSLGDGQWMGRGDLVDGLRARASRRVNERTRSGLCAKRERRTNS
jgi:hypothetical protein